MHHKLDVDPLPEKPLYVNDVSLTNNIEYFETKAQHQQANRCEGFPEDNIRVYVPLDINKNFLLRDLSRLYDVLGSPSEENEDNFVSEVGKIVARLEIYDQIWVAHKVEEAVHLANVDAPDTLHSKEAIGAVKEIIKILERNEGCAECFPYEMIETLKHEYLR